MRVLFVSDVYFPRVNGVSTSIHTFREDLARLGVESELVVPAYPAHQYEGGRVTADDPQLHVTRIPASGVPADPEDRRMHWRALRSELQRRSARVDLVHVHTPFVAHYAGVRCARRLGVPVIATYHTFFEEYLHHYVPVLPRALGRVLARSFTRSQCAQVDALIAPSEPMLAVLREYGVETPVHVLPTGLPAERFRPGSGPRFRERFGIPADRPLLLFVGRVAHEKNIQFLLRAFIRVRARVPEALFVVAGEGPARASLAALAGQLGLGESIRFVGNLDREQGLADCYAAGDVFVFASRTETQGLVLLEAMAQGRPVVSTAVLGTASILRPGCGASVVPEDEGAFAAAVVQLLQDRGAAAEAGVRCRRYAESWSSRTMAQRLAELYAGVVERHRAAALAAAVPRTDSR